MDIGDHAMILDQQRDLQRYNNLELHRQQSAVNENPTAQRNKARSNLYRTSYLLQKAENTMRDDHRHARLSYLTHRGATALKYNTGDLMRANYSAHYQI